MLIAIHQVLKDRPPDLVLSGINRGGNLGEDATYSGTVAAAMEGTLLGIRSMALSQVYEEAPTRRGRRRRPGRWRCCAGCRASSGRGVLLNVNFPTVPSAQVTGIEVTVQGRHKIGGIMVEGTDPRGQRYLDFWRATAGRGLARHGPRRGARRGRLWTPLCLDLTHRPSMAALEALFR